MHKTITTQQFEVNGQTQLKQERGINASAQHTHCSTIKYSAVHDAEKINEVKRDNQKDEMGKKQKELLRAPHIQF